MRAGRTPKPTGLKMVQGTYRKDRANTQEPQLQPAIPLCPSWLSRKAKTAYREVAGLLCDMRVLTKADRKALELACYAYAEWREIVTYLKENGRSYTTTTEHGTILHRARPECAIEADLYKRVWDALTKFGLTPADRARVKAYAPEKPDPFTELLKRRQRTAAPVDDSD